ncbi:GMC oxidoreductase [uncultured Marinobacter sp.]|uniref:GMC oxidoreductase n=1 Tax=uncultured Marinobacter sp. TaxID=187379 RepID=UPI002355BF9C
MSWSSGPAGFKLEVPPLHPAMAPHRVRLFTAHQMGGCAMGPNPETSVVNGFGEHYPVSNLSVHDASRFPTRIGANPQLSVYARSARNSHHLAGQSRFSRAGTRAAGTYRCPGNAGIMAASEGRSCA